jgi:hypothetical protein
LFDPYVGGERGIVGYQEGDKDTETEDVVYSSVNVQEGKVVIKCHLRLGTETFNTSI